MKGSRAKSRPKNKTATLVNDYERMVPEFHHDSIIYGEHLVRYVSAKLLVKDKVVLDIASGSGYGTASLAESAKKIYGVDVSPEAIAYAKEHYSRKNIQYLLGDGSHIPLEDSSVDIVVSFETIEHIEDYRTFMSEVKRVLRRDGIFLLSTPNDIEFAEGNHFHVHEFNHDELKKLVGDYFSHTKEYFQADWVYSGIHTEDEITKQGSMRLEVMNVLPLSMEKVLYFFMICANREISETIDSLGAVSQHWSERLNQHKLQLTEQHISNINDVSEDRLRYVRKLENIIRKQEEELGMLRRISETKLGKVLLKLHGK